MIKETIENIRRRIKEKKAYREDMAKEYPVDNLFFGHYDKKVSEQGLSYSYKHTDCFLVDRNYAPRKVICVTGDNRNLNQPIECYSKPIAVFGGTRTIYCVKIDGKSYEIDLALDDYDVTYAERTCCANIQSTVDAINYRVKKHARKEAENEAQLNSEFSK